MKLAKLNKSGVRYIVKTFGGVVIQMILFFIAAGTLNVPRGWLFYICHFVVTAITLISLYIVNIELMNKRGGMQEGTKTWDKILLATWMVLLYIIPVVAGLDIGRYQWTSLNFIYAIIGIVLWVFGLIIGTWPMLVNKHFEASVRIQTERDHQVVTTGPYRFIRHPGYLGGILYDIGIPLIFGSLLTIIPVSIIIGIFILRTYLEDKTLQEELEGYLEYTKKTKYRLIPKVW